MCNGRQTLWMCKFSKHNDVVNDARYTIQLCLSCYLKGETGSGIPGGFKTMFKKRRMPQKLQTVPRKEGLKQPLSKL